MLKKVFTTSIPARMMGRMASSENLKTPVTRKLVIEELNNREIIKVEGEEAVPFLQGLITNDMNHLMDSRQGVPTMYALFLNKGGRMLYDTIIYRSNEPHTFLIECDKDISSELIRHLRVYRVRRKVNIENMEKILKPWVIFDPEARDSLSDMAKGLGPDPICALDPRVRDLGWRLVTAAERCWGDVAGYFSIPGEVSVESSSDNYNYRYHRYRYGVGEGINDLPPGKCFPLEMNGDFLHGISFQKGCYIGQELTARVFHTGVVRKRLMPLSLTAKIKQNVTTVQSTSSANVGTIRGVCNDRGLALLRVEQVLKEPHLMIDGETCYVEKPSWWPKELPSKINLQEKA